MNIREFAGLCGVAPGTASRALSRPQEQARVSRAVYERIHAKAREVGFHVNCHARALFSAKSNTIGCIAGGPMNMLCGYFVESIMPVLTAHGKSFSMYPCCSDLELEAKAFDHMLYNKVDAVIHIPALQADPACASAHIREVLDKYPGHPPVVSIYGGSTFTDFHQIRIPEYRTGQQAAWRQLARGCRKFGTITFRLTNLFSQELNRGYRETLLANGIPPENIKEIILQDMVSATTYAALRDVEGIWCGYHMILLLTCKQLQEVCDLGKLHVDSVYGTELETVFRDLLPATATLESPRNFFNWFGSLVIHKIDLREFSSRAAETALKLCDAPDTPPQIEYLDLISEAFEYGDEPVSQ